MSHILVVDDEDVVLKFTYHALLRANHTVTTTSNPIEALKLFSPQKFDLVILDIVMPQMDGPALGARLREKDPHIPILYTTGDTGHEHVDVGRGPHESLIPKPYTMHTICQEVDKMLHAVIPQ